VIAKRDLLRYRALPGREAADPFEGARADGFCLRVVRIRASAGRSPHRHPHSQEAIYAVSGGGTLWEDGVGRRFEAGDAALVEAGVAHATVPDPGTAMELVCFFPHPRLERNIEEIAGIVITGEGWEEEA
jgi:quercetin dioxygenase-like cupin family protein